MVVLPKKKLGIYRTQGLCRDREAVSELFVRSSRRRVVNPDDWCPLGIVYSSA